MNILSNLDEIANLIIRPSRYTYKMTDLGNKAFKIDEKLVTRQDFEVKNQRNLKIKCSLYASQQIKQVTQVLIYLHCNSGSRVEGLSYLKMAIQNNFAYLIFDFTGSGLSDGKYVSLGFYQTLDLECVYSHLKTIINQKAKIILWGRSMGAATALNFLLKKKYDVFLAVFDSPFRSLRQLFIQIGRQKTSFPDFILEMAYKYLKPVIQEQAGFDIEKVDLNFESNSIENPGIFIASKQDALVPFSQIDQLFNLYSGQKQMVFIEQGHNQARSPKIISGIFESIKKKIAQAQIKSQKRIQKEAKKYYSFIPQKGQRLPNQLQKKDLSRKKLQLTIKSLSQRQLLTTTLGKICKQDQLLNFGKDITNKSQLEKYSRKINVKDIDRNQENLSQNLRNSFKKQKMQSFQFQTGVNLQAGVEKNENNAKIKFQESMRTPVLQKKPISCLLPHKKSFKVISIEQQENNYEFIQSDKRILQNNRSESKLRIKKKPFQIKNFFGNQTCMTSQKQLGILRNKKSVQIQDEKLTNRLLTNKNFNIPASNSKLNDTVKNTSEIFPTNKFNPASQIAFRSKNHKLIIREPSSDRKQTQKQHKNNLSVSQRQKAKQKEQPHSQIKNEGIHINKINYHEDFIRQKEFLKRCQSLQKVFKTQQDQLRQNIRQNSSGIVKFNHKRHQENSDTQLLNHQTYRQIKCTQRVLQKIIEKQQKRSLVVNVQNMTLKSQKQVKQLRQVNQKNEVLLKQRKTLQHIVNKKPPFVQLKGIKNFRNSLQSKYKTQIRK